MQGRPAGAWATSQASGAPFKGEAAPRVPLTPPHRVTEGSLWYKSPLDYFFSYGDGHSVLSSNRSFYSTVFEKLIKNQLQEIHTNRNWYLSEQDVC